MTRYLLVLVLGSFLASCTSKKEACYKDSMFAWSVQQKFYFSSLGFSPEDFTDPLSNHQWKADSTTFMRTIAYELQLRGLEVTDGLFGGVLAIKILQKRDGMSAPEYENKVPESWPKLDKIPRGAWVLDILSFDKETLLMRSWAVPEDAEDAETVIQNIKKAARKACACYPTF